MLTVLIASFAPALALLMFLYLKDELDPEPVTLVAKGFFFGMLLVFPVSFLQFGMSQELYFSGVLMQSFIQVALVEEFFKWFTVMLFIFHHVEFNSRYDGIVYASSVSLGFASLENLFYLSFYGIEIAIYRALFPVTVHALVGVLMGYYFGMAKFSPNKRKSLLSLALLIPVLFHGLYHVTLSNQTVVLTAMVPLMVALWAIALQKIKQANQDSLSDYLKDTSDSLYSSSHRHN
ncbi:glutamic-type intramembrane protease PrsW [Salisediminibacterium selenitireducens]|uniref:Protease PrsW n=1 Tax=Bacillus selenitireducens (strain ATCC 700615 / DSM 15326 / MLS10) TaxID=439292 RepID=D6XVB7_BACIE|nr:glutamic-type intramembrane protease PrsW [Salisediminibacterium selenitireducens]ADH99655.1 membrane protein-like protein [[Bacillus] selenitireducens MLS10]